MTSDKGYAKPWKVNFPEDRRVVNKGEGRAAHAIGKVRPAGDTRQIKEQRRHTVRGKLSHLPKDDSEDERGEKWLEDVPERAQNRLFVSVIFNFLPDLTRKGNFACVQLKTILRSSHYLLCGFAGISATTSVFRSSTAR